MSHWIKLWTEVLDDAKMAQYPDHLWRRVVEMFLFTGKIDGAGHLPPLADMAWTLHTTPDALANDLDALAALPRPIISRDPDNLSNWIVCKFVKRQEPMSDAERQRRKRQRDELGIEPVTVRDSAVTENVTQSESEIESESETDAEADPDLAAAAAPPPSCLPELTLVEPPAETPKQKRADPVPLTTALTAFLDLFNAKRFANTTQRQVVAQLEIDYGADKLLEAGRWAAERGLGLGQAVGAVKGALPKWGQSRASPGRNGGSNSQNLQYDGFEDKRRAKHRADALRYGMVAYQEGES